jgi:hypothetical protein
VVIDSDPVAIELAASAGYSIGRRAAPTTLLVSRRDWTRCLYCRGFTIRCRKSYTVPDLKSWIRAIARASTEESMQSSGRWQMKLFRHILPGGAYGGSCPHVQVMDFVDGIIGRPFRSILLYWRISNWWVEFMSEFQKQSEFHAIADGALALKQ